MYLVSELGTLVNLATHQAPLFQAPLEGVGGLSHSKDQHADKLSRVYS